jgi:peptidoglycan/xylan/chitin deacetylase (PgdA/CDA1 family)
VAVGRRRLGLDLGRRAVELAGTILAVVALALLRSSRRRVGLVLMYHRVSDPRGKPEYQLVPTLAPAIFERQLGHLRRWYRVVPASEIRMAVNGRRRWERFPVALTFDDDLPTHHQVAMPLLGEVGLSGTFFLNGWTPHRPRTFWWELLQEAWDRHRLHGVSSPPEVSSLRSVQGVQLDIHGTARLIERLPPACRRELTDVLTVHLASRESPRLAAGDMRAIAEAGHEIGFHTARHDRLVDLADGDLRDALLSGRAELERLVGQRIDLLAYPHGVADNRVANAAQASGYAVAFTNRSEAVTPSTNPWLVGRVDPPISSSSRLALRLIRTLTRRGTVA